MPRVARVPAIPPLPPAIFAQPPWFSPLCPCHPPKRPIWWMNCPFVSAIHQNAPFGGWAPVPSPNRPGLGLVSRKVGAFSGGPSMPEACFPEGRRLFRGTFHTRGLFPGRSAPFQGDLPCQRPVSRKVGAFSGGTFHARGLFPGRSVPFQGDLPCQRPISRKVGAFSGGPSMPEACFPEGPDIILGDQPRRDRFFGRSWGLLAGKVVLPSCFLPRVLPKTAVFEGTLLRFSKGRITWASSRRLPGPLVLVGSCRVGRHEATCHPRLGGCLRSDGPCAEGRRGSPVPPHPTTHQTPLFASNPNIFYFC